MTSPLPRSNPGLSRRVLLAGLGATATLGGCAPMPSAPTPSPEPTRTTAGPTPSPTSPPTPAWVDPLPEGPFNVLLAGTDTWDDPTTGRPDVMVVAQIGAARDHVTLVSLPRDAWIPIDGGREGKANSAYGGDIARLMRTVSAALGDLPLHASALTGFAGYSAIVDALGRLEVDNTIESTFIDPTDGHPSHFPAGRITLSTADWLVYARQRKELPRGDLDRTARHRAILIGMLRRIRELARHDVAALAGVARAVFAHVAVTGPLTPELALDLAPQLATFDADAVTRLMVPVAGFGDRGGQSVTLLDAAKTADLAAALASGDARGYATRTAGDPATR